MVKYRAYSRGPIISTAIMIAAGCGQPARLVSCMGLGPPAELDTFIVCVVPVDLERS